MACRAVFALCFGVLAASLQIPHRSRCLAQRRATPVDTAPDDAGADLTSRKIVAGLAAVGVGVLRAGSAVLTLTNAAVLRAWKAEAPPPRLVGAGAAALFAAGALFLAETDGYGGPVFTPPDVTKPSTARSAALAAHLKAKGAKMYGAYWCSHCFNQKQEFGKTAYKAIDYYECAEDGYASRRDACQARDIKGYPTWEIGGALYPGEKTLDELAALSGFVE
ncbi:vitamin K epoxide reductase-like protein [Aureococcus anophagefferens]|nr:vitamin K epoxide reductase-like protein [Aureococcus anophagefferens]